MIKAKKKKIIIEPNVPISDLTEQHPEVIDILIYDYGLHCVGCVIAQYETLEEGAMAHGLGKQEFKKLMKAINDRVNV